MAKRKRRSGLGATTKQHAVEANRLIDRIDTDVRLAHSGSCGMRLTSLKSAIEKAGELQAHAFGSGGKVAKGAYTPKTVSDSVAVKAYNALKDVNSAYADFRRSCLKDS